jgi:hypothetical protein
MMRRLIALVFRADDVHLRSIDSSIAIVLRCKRRKRALAFECDGERKWSTNSYHRQEAMVSSTSESPKPASGMNSGGNAYSSDEGLLSLS